MILIIFWINFILGTRLRDWIWGQAISSRFARALPRFGFWGRHYQNLPVASLAWRPKWSLCAERRGDYLKMKKSSSSLNTRSTIFFFLSFCVCMKLYFCVNSFVHNFFSKAESVNVSSLYTNQHLVNESNKIFFLLICIHCIYYTCEKITANQLFTANRK